jgi:hypothetical protein
MNSDICEIHPQKPLFTEPLVPGDAFVTQQLTQNSRNLRDLIGPSPVLRARSALEMCCEYLLPSVDATRLTRRIANIILQALFIYDADGGETAGHWAGSLVVSRMTERRIILELFIYDADGGEAKATCLVFEVE